MTYLVAFGAPVPFSRLRRVAKEVGEEWDVVPGGSPGLRDSFPDEDVVAILVAADSVGDPTAASPRLVSHRHTVTGALRRLVQRAATQLGRVDLLVHDASGVGLPARRQTASLQGFLRLGRVVQDDVLLSIQSRSSKASKAVHPRA
jgi:NAD(P)-dependent dehydrogenase (short-subunit alcohol dehydrogenase family)